MNMIHRAVVRVLGHHNFSVRNGTEILMDDENESPPTQAMIDEAIADLEAEDALIVPEQVSMRQARLALLQAGLLDEVQTLVESLPPAGQIEWEYSSTVRRDHPLIAALASLAGLSDADIDQLFRDASTI